VQQHIDTTQIQAVTQFVEINPKTLKLIKEKQGDYNTQVINLVKSIEKAAGEASDDPYLVGMAERAKLLGGELRISSEAGKGTTVTVETPI
jgi:type I restriction enzyme R subunit